MNFFTLTGIEITKIRRSKILLLLLFAAMLMWIPAIINSGSLMNVRDIPITPEHNFLFRVSWVWYGL